MEPTRSTFELHRGKNKRESVELTKVENGYIIRHYPVEGPCKEYVADDYKAAKKRVSECLGKEMEEVGKPEEVPKNALGASTPYENKY